LIVRAEQPSDAAAIRAVHDAAFNQPHEGRLVDVLRVTSSLVSLVAEAQGEIVGHVMFSRVTISGTMAVALAPMAVAPSRQRRGIGTTLVKAGLDELRRREEKIVVVLGHPQYYPRFGFVPAKPHGILPPFECAENAWMVMPLAEWALNGVTGTVRYPPAFDGV